MLLLTAPLKCTGEISARYMGASPAFSPEFIPMKNLPIIIISKEPAAFAEPVNKYYLMIFYLLNLMKKLGWFSLKLGIHNSTSI